MRVSGSSTLPCSKHRTLPSHWRTIGLLQRTVQYGFGRNPRALIAKAGYVKSRQLVLLTKLREQVETLPWQCLGKVERRRRKRLELFRNFPIRPRERPIELFELFQW
jgi:hypothetical protein